MILSLFIFSCDEEEKEYVRGCTDEAACNFNPDAEVTFLNDSCVYLPEGNGYWNYGENYIDEPDGICGEGDDYIDFNGNGICDTENGDTFLNDIAGNGVWDWEDLNQNGVCDEGECEEFIDESNYDCDGNCTAEVDCNGECGGDNSICLGCMSPSACNFDPQATIPNSSCIQPIGCNNWCPEDNGSPGEVDCAGECGGTASIDDCGLCTGGNTSNAPNYIQDCNGDCLGSAFIDDCGICTSGNTGFTPNFLEDECGVCNGDNSLCADECGIPNGIGASYDCGGLCGGFQCSSDDCSAPWNPNYDCWDNCIVNIDCNGICDGNGCFNQDCNGYPSELFDCNGDCLDVFNPGCPCGYYEQECQYGNGPTCIPNGETCP